MGIIAAQSIGEPGTQLTMRTFHTGGVAGLDITAGPAARRGAVRGAHAQGQGEISHIDGVVEIIQTRAAHAASRSPRARSSTPRCASRKGHELLVAEGDIVEANQVVAAADEKKGAKVDEVRALDRGLVVKAERRPPDSLARTSSSASTPIPHNAKLLVENGQLVRAGDPITDGPINPQEYLETRGRDAVQRYLVKEVQRVYRSQGVTINDKHIEIIVRQMLRKVRIDQPGDSRAAAGRAGRQVRVRGAQQPGHRRGRRAGHGRDRAARRDQGVAEHLVSFLAAASFQETTRVLTEAAINGAKDQLLGLKENVIIGKLIPAGSGAPQNLAAAGAAARRAAAEALAGGELPEGFGDEEINIFLAEAQARAEARRKPLPAGLQPAAR